MHISFSQTFIVYTQHLKIACFVQPMVQNPKYSMFFYRVWHRKPAGPHIREAETS